MNPRFGRRSWVKLWVNEWLDGTTRFEMSDTQRAFWVDLLALAGRSRFPGRICAGEVDGSYIGYPLNRFQSLMAEPIDVQETLELFAKTGKIKLTVTSERPTRLVMIELVNWDRYQSEYQRQKKYRSKGLQQSDSQSYTQSDKTEGEAEGEERRRKATAAFTVLGFDAPFGHRKFQSVWVQRFNTKKPDEWLTQLMEATIQECQAADIGIPPQFYDAKRDVEEREKVDFQNRAR